MTQIIQIIVLFCICLFAGFMSGMFGIGGGSVRIPLLNLAGLHLLTAFAINLFVIPFSIESRQGSIRESIPAQRTLFRFHSS
jgi:uncharacterized membrane protein YfcA